MKYCLSAQIVFYLVQIGNNGVLAMTKDYQSQTGKNETDPNASNTQLQNRTEKEFPEPLYSHITLCHATREYLDLIIEDMRNIRDELQSLKAVFKRCTVDVGLRTRDLRRGVDYLITRVSTQVDLFSAAARFLDMWPDIIDDIELNVDLAFLRESIILQALEQLKVIRDSAVMVDDKCAKDPLYTDEKARAHYLNKMFSDKIKRLEVAFTELNKYQKKEIAKGARESDNV